jgi:hypothetical protein
MKILIVCKDIGSYIRKLSDFLSVNHDVLFVDMFEEKYQLNFIPRKIRGGLKSRLNSAAAKRKIRSMGKFDFSLVVNPGQVHSEVVRCATDAADKNIAYLYDGFSSKPVTKEILGRFDKVYSFDAQDAREHGFLKLHNYIYDEPNKRSSEYKYKAFVVMAGRDRADILSRLADELDRQGVQNYKFLLQSKKIPGLNRNLTFFRERVSLQAVAEFIVDSEIVVDIVRSGHGGLSFRFFEAMLHRKKIITTNRSVTEYDFFNPHNILVIDPDHPEVPEHFLSGRYVDVPDEVFNRYTMRSWVNEVFGPI